MFTALLRWSIVLSVHRCHWHHKATPHLQVSKVRVMHVGVAESWQQEMLSMCLMSLPCPVTIQAGQEDEDLPS